MQSSTNPAIAQAMQSIAAAIPTAAADPARPVYHFCPPALWMNDPNGTIYHDGWFHLFYQHNPYGDDWGHMHWGHARSRDLVQWEHLPIALWPSRELNEEHVFSGCARMDAQGQPLLFYTSVQGTHGNRPPNEQWAALGDADWITWQKHPANPILSLKTEGAPPFEGDWRDPYIFEEAGRTFLVIAGAYDDTAGVGLYEAEDGTLLRWRYHGLLYQKPRSEVRFLECPNFFKVDGKWVLLTSPYRPVEYAVGEFDAASLTFTPQTEGVLDAGFSDVPNYYATNTLYDAEGRCILLGWVRGFAKEQGWNGCLALPRILSIGADGHPRQTPIPALEQLRGRRLARPSLVLHNRSQVLDNVNSDTLEILMSINLGSASVVGLNLRRSADGASAVLMRYDRQTLHVAGTEIPFVLEDEPLTLHIFLDKSVLEVFVNEGRTAITRIITAPKGAGGVEFFAHGGSAQVITLEVWEMKPVTT